MRNMGSKCDEYAACWMDEMASAPREDEVQRRVIAISAQYVQKLLWLSVAFVVSTENININTNETQ